VKDKRRPPAPPSGRKRGGQPGHRRHTRAMVPPEHVRETFEVKPAHCGAVRKPSGGTASEWGSRFVERVLSVAATCRQQGRNVLEYLTSCFQSRVTGDPLPSLLTCLAVINSP
jgi:hypothetical protein